MENKLVNDKVDDELKKKKKNLLTHTRVSLWEEQNGRIKIKP